MVKLIWLILVSWLIIGPASMRIHSKTTFFIFLATLAVSVGWAAPAVAFQLRPVMNGAAPLGAGEVEVDWLADTQSESINALSGEIYFSTSTLSLGEIRDGRSFISLWVNRPAIKSVGVVTFSGITPGGYRGAGGILVELIFKVLKPGTATVEIKNVEAFRNDGAGSPAAVFTAPLYWDVRGENIATNTVYRDTTAPQPFAIQAERSPALFNNHWFLVYTTTDKESGVDHYEVQESIGAAAEAGWIRAESPYELRDQARTQYVFVKAVDAQGNSRVAELIPAQQNYLIIIYPVIALVVIIVMFTFVFKRRPWHR